MGDITSIYGSGPLNGVKITPRCSVMAFRMVVIGWLH